MRTHDHPDLAALVFSIARVVVDFSVIVGKKNSIGPMLKFEPKNEPAQNGSIYSTSPIFPLPGAWGGTREGGE